MTVIIVTAPANGNERRYDADGYTITDGTLFATRKGETVACHAAGLWTSFRTGDAVTDDEQAKRLLTAHIALSAITRISDPNDGIRLAADAIYQIEDGEFIDYRALLVRAVRELADSGSPGQNRLAAELARDGGIEL